MEWWWFPLGAFVIVGVWAWLVDMHNTFDR